MWLHMVLLLLVLPVHGDEQCSWGTYGENCDRPCPSNCYPVLRRNLIHCQKDTGKCSEGCVRGYHGDQCNTSCSGGCLNETCNHGNGHCTLGCKEIYIGDFCNETLDTVVTTHATLSTTEASSSEPEVDLLVIIIPIIVIIICLVIPAVVVCLVRKRKRRRKADFENRFQEDIPLLEKTGAGAARPERGVAQHNPESDPLGQKINNARALFVETASFEKVREMLETFHHVTISGAPGEGKTSMALMFGAEYRKQGYQLIVVEDLDNVQLSDWQGDGKDVCLIFDDIFQMAGPYLDVPRLTHLLYELHLHLTQCTNRPGGRYESYQQESGEEGRRDKQSNMYLIFTSESTTLEHARSQLGGQTFRFFSNSTIADLTKTKSFSYTDEEKKEIWQKHSSHYKYKAKVEVIGLGGNDKQTIGFPLVCRLLSSYAAFQENHETFLENPVSSLRLELHEIISRWDDRSAALILVLLCDGQLNIGQLETESDSELKTHLQAVLTLVPTSTNQSVAEAVRSLCGSLLTEGNITTFSHSVVYDVCVSVLYSIKPEFVREHFSIQILMKHVQDQKTGTIPVNEHRLIIPFSDSYSEALVDRMVDSLFSNINLSKYVMQPIWKRKEIIKKVSKMLKDIPSLSNHAKHQIFCYACFIGDKSIMKKLLPHCDIISRGLNGWTPAMYAVVSGQKDSLERLVKGKADLNLCDDNSNTLLHMASEYGSTSVVEYLLQNHRFDINNPGVHGWTPLACAVFAGKKDVLDILLKCKALRDTTIKNALHLAFEWGNSSIVKNLLPRTGVNYRCKYGQTPMMCAVSSGQKEVFDLLVSRKADINLRDDNNNSLLHSACQPDNTSILENLLSQLDINIPGQHGWTPVMKAAVNGRKDVYDLLVKENADLKLKDDNGNNLLHLACHGGNVSIVKNLLPQFDINSRGGNGWTPVMYAVVSGHDILFHLLVSQGVDLSLRDYYDNSVFHLGCLGGNRVIVKELLPKADLNSQGNLGRTGVMKAAWAGNTDVFKLLLLEKADLKTLDDNNDTILHLSSQGGNCSIVDYLIKEGFDITCRGKHDWTAVMNAAWSGKKDVFDLLSSKQGSMSAYNVYGDTILHLACEGGNIPIVQSLLSTLRPDVNIRGKNGRTPVMAAAWAGRNDVFELLVSKNADLKLIDNYSSNILHLACRGGNTLIIEYLLPLFDITVPGEDGFTPLMMAALSGKKEAYDLLVTRGAGKSSLTSTDDNVLHAACQGGNLAIVKEVVDSFDINCRGKNGQTPLMRAVCGGHIAVYKYLVSRDADLTLVDKDGRTLLHLASRHGQLVMLKHIIDGSDVNTKDNMGLTPAMTAVLHTQGAVLKYMKDKGTHFSLVDNAGDDALTLALKLGSRQVIKQLDRKHDKKVTPWNELMKSLVRGELTFLKTFGQKSPDLVEKDQAGDTLLHLACRGGNRHCVEYLLPSYDINVQGQYNWTPVMMAAACGHADVFQLLVDHKAGLYHVSDTREDILALARLANNTDIIAYLEKDE
ncbi:serine/threonine-protein phosphatase 6 regulatory ankyrin repeat subunit A-like [Haliotis rubra]|uniref:serine/threonine-protein phosphatase 6 regulatory ankyrin repeat subunit A-like n=1 Tax=Haliotis rubra TaxID=36100 RepID=UPI001EE4FAF1|nr:serine/threonine-protein phosphatase 6 regulatory ankyrin repeat subunit A-like [Haliotis rubra]